MTLHQPITPGLSPALCAELAKLDAEQILILLGEIVEPSIHTPFTTDEEFDEALAPVTDAYRAAYDTLRSIALGEDGDPEAAYWAKADFFYDQARDDAMIRADMRSAVLL